MYGAKVWTKKCARFMNFVISEKGAAHSRRIGLQAEGEIFASPVFEKKTWLLPAQVEQRDPVRVSAIFCQQTSSDLLKLELLIISFRNFWFSAWFVSKPFMVLMKWFRLQVFTTGEKVCSRIFWKLVLIEKIF